MAEFQEVMKQYERMCKAHICNDNCPIYKVGVCSKIGRCVTEYGIEKVEQTIMQWAAEHPEPVYPTWAEYLMHIYQDVSYARILGETIPADTAEKLGLQPKEAKYSADE